MTSKQTAKPWICSKIPAKDSGLWGQVPPNCWWKSTLPLSARVDSVYSKSWVFPLGNSSQWWDELCCLNLHTSSFLFLLKWQKNLSLCMGACMVLFFAPSFLYFCTEIFFAFLLNFVLLCHSKAFHVICFDEPLQSFVCLSVLLAFWF